MEARLGASRNPRRCNRFIPGDTGQIYRRKLYSRQRILLGKESPPAAADEKVARVF